MSTKALQRLEVILIFLSVFAWIGFLASISFNRADYFERIDPVNQEGYLPFASKHAFSLFVFGLLSFISLFQLSTKGAKLPPLQIVIYVSFSLIGIILTIFMMIQVSENYDPVTFADPSVGLLMIPAPFFHFCLSIVILQKFVHEQRVNASQRSYKNKWLNFINSKLSDSKNRSIWVVIVVFPLLLLISLILVLFGQDADSLVKVFTETTTWTFSQKTHPPFLDHQGHYLCTVAACGSPKIVKPQRLGMRHGHEIIVNRQLMIANAFEEMIQDKSPRFHRWIRRNYDRFGYPLSKQITSIRRSNLTYMLMKPLEWCFLVALYLFSPQPEVRIKRQYAWKC